MRRGRKGLHGDAVACEREADPLALHGGRADAAWGKLARVVMPEDRQNDGRGCIWARTYFTVSAYASLTRTCVPCGKSDGCKMRQLESARASLGQPCTWKLCACQLLSARGVLGDATRTIHLPTIVVEALGKLLGGLRFASRRDPGMDRCTGAPDCAGGTGRSPSEVRDRILRAGEVY